MRLSACYIVKGEYMELEKSLASVQPAISELIVVMTAEVPEVRKVAENAGAQVYNFSWQQDFSLARNFALEKLTGDWVIFLDADEFFVYPQRVAGSIDRLVADQPKADIIMVKRTDIFKEGDALRFGAIHRDPRIFRLHEELRYHGRIHEMLAWADGRQPQLVFANDDLLVYHTGYAAHLMQDKIQRNLSLLQRGVEEEGETPASMFYMADCCFGLGKYQQALEYSLKVLQSDFLPVGSRTRPYHVAIESMRQLDMPLEPMLAMADLGISMFPDMPDFYGERGMILCGMGRVAEAVPSFHKALQLYEKPQTDVHEESFFAVESARRVAKRLREIKKIIGEKSFLSACYIVKNEASNLAKSLDSISSQVDEIIVVDTGSSDGTVSVAKEFGAQCYTIPWQDDFALARNYALKKATGEWIIFLDADEYFTAETASNLQNVLLKHNDASLCMIYMQNLDIDTGESLLDFYAPRIFRNREGMAYVGRIHEQLRCNGGLVEPIVCIPSTELQLIHTGYSQQLSEAKAKRNLKLLLREVQEAKHPELFYMYLAETYDGLDDEDKAVYYAEKDIATGKKAVAYASRSYRLLLRIYMQNPTRYPRRREIARKASEDFPDLPDFHAELAECLAYELDFVGAIAAAEKALTLFQGYQGMEPSFFTVEAEHELQHRRQVWESVIQRMKTIRIVSCLIATDAERDLLSYLRNTAVFSDARILVDGGSLDKTPVLARENGCIVVEKHWQGDFAAARNAALARAEGDWAVVMDVDEVVQEPEKLRAFLAFFDITRPDIDAIMVTIINVDEDDEMRELYRFPYTRFLRLNRGLYYQGRIHEQLVKNDGEVQLYQENYRLPIVHTGYSSRRIQQKLQRNLELLQLEIREQGEKPAHYRYLAETYFGLGQVKLACRYALLAIDRGAATVGTRSDMYYLAWQCMDMEKVSHREQVEFINKAQKMFPDLPEFWGIGGRLAYDAGQCTQAYAQLKRAIDLYEQPSKAGGACASSFAGFADEVYGRLADLEMQAGETQQAVLAWEKAFQHNRHNVQNLNLYCQWHRESHPDKLAAALWQKFGSDRQALPFLARFAENYGWLALFHCWLAEMGQRCPLIYGQAMAGEPQEFFSKRLLPGMVKIMQDVPVLLVALEQKPSLAAHELLNKCAGLLPQEMYHVWQVYRGEAAELREPRLFTAEELNRFLPAFRQWGTKEQQAKLVNLYRKLGLEDWEKFQREMEAW